MVSMAGGLALSGLLPVVNTFASFLSARANEQIYNNACEQTRIIYVNHYAGLIPAGPGQSHQSIRDISLFGALPNFTMLQPCNADETRMAVKYVIDVSPRMIQLPAGYQLSEGYGITIVDGTDAVLFTYGPVMLNEAMLAAELLREKNFSLKVVNMPWLNRVDAEWLEATVGNRPLIYVLEDHSPVGGLGDSLVNELIRSDLGDARRFRKFGVEGHPACGTPAEALQHHGLDGESLAETILRDSMVSNVARLGS
jgi:transketolase